MTTLKRSLGFWALAVYGVGSIVGAGIYSVLGAAAGEAKGLLWVSLLIAGVAAFLAALSYAELASMFPKAGGEYQYLRKAMPKHKAPAFIAGALVAVNAAASAATVSLAFGGYLQTFVAVPTGLAALGLLIACTIVNIAGIRQSTWLAMSLIAVEVGGLLLLIGGGFATAEPFSVIPESWGEVSGKSAGVFAAAALLFFMFIGFEDVANLSEEAHEPRRDIPRALLLAVIVTSVLYLLVALAVLAVAEPELLADSDSPLTVAGNRVAPWLGQALAFTALFSTASTALISLVAVSRLLLAMARDGYLPKALGSVLPGRKTPWLAALSLFGAAALLLLPGEIKITASVSAMGLLCVFVAIHATVIWLRRSAPKQQRLFRIPLAIAKVPVSAALGLLMALAFLTQFEPRAYLLFAIALSIAAMLYLLMRRRAAR